MKNPELFFPELSPIENKPAAESYSQIHEVILVISIDIGDGKKDLIQVYEHDNPEQLAVEFTHKHKLGVRAKMLITEEIQKYLKIAVSRVLTLNAFSEASHKRSLGEFSLKTKNKKNFSAASMEVQKKLRQSPAALLNIPAAVNRASSKQLTPSKSAILDSNTPVREPVTQQSSPYNPYKTFSSQSPNPKSQTKIRRSSSRTIQSTNTDFKEIFRISEKKDLDKSQKLVKKIKQQRYREIFNLLSPNTNGTISVETVKNSRIPNKIRKIIQPLIDELEEMKETLIFQEFFDAMEMLMKVLPPGDKSELLSSSKAKPPTKKTVLNKTGNKTNHSRNMSMSSLYDRGVQRKQELSRRLEKEKEQIQRAELSECKFVPTVSKKSKNSLI